MKKAWWEEYGKLLKSTVNPKKIKVLNDRIDLTKEIDEVVWEVSIYYGDVFEAFMRATSKNDPFWVFEVHINEDGKSGKEGKVLLPGLMLTVSQMDFLSVPLDLFYGSLVSLWESCKPKTVAPVQEAEK